MNLDNLTKLTINPFPIIAESLDSHIKQEKHILHTSEIGYCKKQTILRHIYNKYEPKTMRTLAGTISHKLIEHKPTRTKLIESINKQLNIDTFPIATSEIENNCPLPYGYILQLHPDILTPYYTIEIKNTAMPTRKWTKEVAAHQIMQCNTYCGFYEKPVGILLLINLNVFLSSSKDWNYIMNNYIFTYPFQFDSRLYDETMKRANHMAECIELEKVEKYGDPEMTWECAKCNVMEECGRQSYYCQHVNKEGRKCRKQMCEYPDLVSKEFQDQPLCENHSRKRDYVKWKYKEVI